MTYAAEPTGELLYPVPTEIAFTVSLAATEIATVYKVEPVVGVDPSVV
jgi:hypothetical protein